MTSDTEKIYLPFSRTCFVCGDENHAGLHTRFYVENGDVKTRLTAREVNCGCKDVVHGGIVAAVLDETMGWAAARALERMCVTGELTVRYILNVPNDREFTVSTRVQKSNRRLALTEGEIVDDEGTTYATATAKFLPLSIEKTLEVDDGLVYLGGEERIFDQLRAAQNYT